MSPNARKRYVRKNTLVVTTTKLANPTVNLDTVKISDNIGKALDAIIRKQKDTSSKKKRKKRKVSKTKTPKSRKLQKRAKPAVKAEANAQFR